jgi:hypothetical protein
LRRIMPAGMALGFGLGLPSWAARAAAEPLPEAAGSLFGFKDSLHFSGIGAARLDARPSRAQNYEPGFEFRFADELSWSSDPAQIEGSFGSSLRILPHGYAISFAQISSAGGLRWGPAELRAGFGLSLLNVDTVLGGWDLSMFWPRSFAGVRFVWASVRVDILAHVEYLWRWFGPDEYVRGIGLMVSLRQGPLGPMFR